MEVDVVQVNGADLPILRVVLEPKRVPFEVRALEFFGLAVTW